MSGVEASDRAAEYRRRLAERGEALAAESRLDRSISILRLVVFASGVALVWPALFDRTVHVAWLLAPFAAFVAVLRWHDRVIRGRDRAARAVAFYEQGLVRVVEGRATGPATDRWSSPDHPYAQDLDLFGPGSLFERVCAAKTRAGEDTLAAWLSRPADPGTVVARQRAVAELSPRLDLREGLAVAGGAVSIDADGVRVWAGASPRLSGRLVPAVALVLGAANVTTLIAWFTWPSTFPWFLASASIGAVFGLVHRGKVEDVLGRVERPERDLERLSAILETLERETFTASLLRELRASLDVASDPPSARIAHLARLVEWRDSLENMIFRPLAALVFGGTHLAYAMERWRSRSGAAVGRWIDATAAIEALSSFAQVSYERPGDPFPELVDEGPRFEARGLRHPLLADCVANDLAIDRERRLYLVSGSNMSGKSTLMRTVGVNAVLAQAGATVAADALTLSPLAIATSMRIHDSLQQGTSHFYAEIKRLRRIVDLTGETTPVCFLLDEILHGTNSHDRRAGAAAVIRGLLARGAVGLVSTHDLALAEIVDELEGKAANVHFRDRIVDGRVEFDYRLAPGVVRNSNALELMRAVGLDV